MAAVDHQPLVVDVLAADALPFVPEDRTTTWACLASRPGGTEAYQSSRPLPPSLRAIGVCSLPLSPPPLPTRVSSLSINR